MDGKALTDTEDFRFRIAEMAPGSEHHFVVTRKGVRRTLTIALGEQPENMRQAYRLKGRYRPGSAESYEVMGITVADLTDKLVESFGFSPDAAGVIITKVRSAAAAGVGLRPGVLVTQVNDVPVESVGEFRTAIIGMATEAVDGIALRIEGPDGAAMSVLLTEPAGDEDEPGDEHNDEDSPEP